MWGKATEKRREYMRQWRKKNRELLRLDSRKQYIRLRQEDPERSRRYHRRAHLKHTYGITLEEYEKMLIVQNNVCAVCLQPETGIRRGEVKSLDVDHNHETGHIRGLLCSACNTALGLLKEDALRISKLLEYVQRHP